ncbi:MAG: type IV secretion system DNA-binding domain-containing protein [Gemmatimonadetes bacterium]|nr:type IV secretion system DNA-binding domain-containing protein [Gemmatimonadota bacterium]
MTPVADTEAALQASAAEARRDLLQPLAAALLVLVTAHLLPKPPHGRPFRFALTVAYFAAALQLCWSLNQPLQRYLNAYYAAAYRGAPLMLRRSWQQFVRAVGRIGNTLSWASMLFVILTGLRVLQHWIPSLGVFSPLSGWPWWIALASIGLFPLYARGMITEGLERWHALEDNRSLSRFTPHPVADAAGAGDEPAMLVIDEGSFRAGGFNWQWDDFHTSCVVFGQPGSGKTVCVLNALVDGLVSSLSGSAMPPAGLILDPKGDFRGRVTSLMARAGRPDDLLILDPSTPEASARWNPLDTSDDELELADRLAACMQALGRSSSQHDSFWIDSAKRFLRHAIRLVRASNVGEPPSFTDLADLATRDEAIAERIDRMNLDDAGAVQAARYFEDEWRKLADQTRASISAHVTSLIDPFLVEPYNTFFAGRSTVSIARLVDEGKVLYVDMPIAEREAMSRTVCTLIKLEYYREVLRRPGKERQSFFLCDEFQQFMTTSHGRGDADFFERSRQSRHANIVATQNYPALLKAARSAGGGDEVVENLVGNCAIKLFLRNTDARTNEWASGLFGRSLVTRVSAARSQERHSFGGQVLGRQDEFDKVVGPEEFAALAMPLGRHGIGYAESIGLIGSRTAYERTTLRWRVHPL